MYDDDERWWPSVVLLLVFAALGGGIIYFTEPPNRPTPNEVCAQHRGVEELIPVDGNNGYVECRDGFAGETESLE